MSSTILSPTSGKFYRDNWTSNSNNGVKVVNVPRSTISIAVEKARLNSKNNGDGLQGKLTKNYINSDTT